MSVNGLALVARLRAEVRSSEIGLSVTGIDHHHPEALETAAESDDAVLGVEGDRGALADAVRRRA